MIFLGCFRIGPNKMDHNGFYFLIIHNFVLVYHIKSAQNTLKIMNVAQQNVNMFLRHNYQSLFFNDNKKFIE